MNVAAAKAGLQVGFKFTDAKARVPDLVTDEMDRAADAAALRALGIWLYRFSPLIALDGDDGLMLETTGCAHLHAGEAALVAAIEARLLRAGFTARFGLAGTPGAAYALARAGTERILDSGAERAGLERLPVRALRLSEDAVTLLRRFGLTRMGQLYGIDRKALARRFQSREAADAVGLRLDQALGLRPEPLQPLRPAPEQASHLPCPEPLTDLAALTEGLRQLSETLGAELVRFGEGARAFRFIAFRSDGEVSSVAVTASRAARDPAHIQRLFRDKLERINPGFGIDHLTLEARRLAPMQIGAVRLPGALSDEALDDAALAALADRLTAKLGEGAVTVRLPAARHIPEAAEVRAPFEGFLPDAGAANESAGPRPARMFIRPERVDVLAEVPDGPPLRFVWRRLARRVVRADGPERIAPEWWREMKKRPSPPCEVMGGEGVSESSEPLRTRPRARDYYRVEDEDGRRYWIFRAGLYEDGRGAAPEWYVHGLFA